ncbi:MAG: saccharopine dehydrogenase NADP-binding domain-containing protein [Acidobacteriia bacterium]|nr:saccharopine dehydrogenase NADP-binding domain-containing protein [Terriglobia bacterium]
MPFSYIVLGAGRQGTAAAYDLAKFGDAAQVILTDVQWRRAQTAADLVNLLAGRNVAEAMALDVRDEHALREALKGREVALSCVPYFYNLELARAAIAAGVSFCDLGGNTDIVRQQHALDSEAKRAGVRIVPDCGMGPGMGNTLGVYAMSLLDYTEHVYLYDGGIPQNPQPPWNYLVSFSIEGLTNEYYGGITVLRGGKLVHLPCFTELEMIEVEPLGKLEAFVVAGGVSTAPWTFQGKLLTYQLKILRYPGCFAQLKAFSDLGLFELQPVQVDGQPVVPRHVFHALFEPKVHADVVKDICIIRARAVGTKNGRQAEAAVEVIDYYDEATGFSSMQRTTGWHLSIVAAMMAEGKTPIGSIPLEIAVPGDAFVHEARKRGFKITEKVVQT